MADPKYRDCHKPVPRAHIPFSTILIRWWKVLTHNSRGWLYCRLSGHTGKRFDSCIDHAAGKDCAGMNVRPVNDQRLKAKSPALSPTNVQRREARSVTSRRKDYCHLLQSCKPEIEFRLYCLTCTDWKTHLTVCIPLNIKQTHPLPLNAKSKLTAITWNRNVVSYIYERREFHEREVYAIFWRKILNHPDMRRLLLTGWTGWPAEHSWFNPANTWQTHR